MDEVSRATVEAIEYPAWHVQFSGSSCDPDVVRRLLDLLHVAVLSVAQEAELDICGLRLIQVVDALESQARFWTGEVRGVQLGLSPLTESEGVVAGKCIVWGDGKEKSTYSVILLSSLLLTSFADEHSQGVVTLAHELGHLHDHTKRLRAGLNDREGISTADWSGLSEAFARSAWSEVFANDVAHLFMTDEMIEDEMQCAVDVLTMRTEIADRARVQFWARPGYHRVLGYCH